MSCWDQIQSKSSSYCKCLTKKTTMVKHPSAASGLIDDIMRKYFCKKAGQGSSCSLFSAPNRSVYSIDKRLRYWSQILEDRKKLACRIRNVTGKRLSHVLYNQIEDHRNVQNVKRIMDLAERLDPTKLSMRKENHLRNSNIFETLPNSEKLQAANIEIVGMPKVSRTEQWMKQGENAFLSSEFLHKKIRAKQFSKIIEYYPETDRLEIVGKRIHKHVHAIERDSDFELSVISSDSHIESLDFPEYCIQINDHTFKIDGKPIQPIEFHLEFQCQLFECKTLKLCRIMNIGWKPVRCAWKKIKPSGFAFMPPVESALHFSQKAFRLTYDETIVVDITFKPTRRMNCQEQWQLIIETAPFEETSYKCIYLKLSGECYIPEDFLHTIVGDIIELVIPHVIPGKVFQRPGPTECELFEKLNPGFKCNHEDLRQFKEIFRQFKNKSYPSVWDLKLQTLMVLIEGFRDYAKRNQGLRDFKEIIREIRRRISYCDLNIKIQLARSVILSSLDKWDTKAIQIVDSVARTEIDVLLIRMPFIREDLENCRTLEDKRKTIQHQALYIQMYCCLRDSVEEIVSFIENCLLLEQNV